MSGPRLGSFGQRPVVALDTPARPSSRTNVEPRGSAGILEFHYRLPPRSGGQRPGAHDGSSLGAGQQFAAHRRLLDHPDPRRIDLRASVREVRGDWLVRIARQRVAVPVHALVDVSASMHFGAGRSKLAVAADFVDALGHSAFRAGDPVGLMGFDEMLREDLFLPARHSRGMGGLMAAMLQDAGREPPRRRALGLKLRAFGRSLLKRAAPAPAQDRDAVAGLRECAARLAGRQGLVFLVSDFHGMRAEAIVEVLELLAPACVLPVLVWDAAETEPPIEEALLALSDAETGVRRTLWIREPLRDQWRDAVAARRAELRTAFEGRSLPPFELIQTGLGGGFDAEALTRHFMECVA